MQFRGERGGVLLTLPGKRSLRLGLLAECGSQFSEPLEILSFSVSRKFGHFLLTNLV